MPDLGAYAWPVLSAYGGGLASLIGVTLVSLWRARKVKAALQRLERERRDG